MQRQEQATSERLWLALEHYSKRQHLEPRLSTFFDLFCFHLFVLLLLLLSSSGISSIPIPSVPSRPRPQTALQLQAHSQSPLAHFPRRHTILSAVFVSTASVSLSLPLADRAVGVCPFSSVLTEAESSQGSRSLSLSAKSIDALDGTA